MGKQYFVQIKGYYERAAFYDYIHKRFKVKDIFFNKDKMASSNFPFVIDFEKNFLTVVERRYNYDRKSKSISSR